MHELGLKVHFCGDNLSGCCFLFVQCYVEQDAVFVHARACRTLAGVWPRPAGRFWGKEISPAESIENVFAVKSSGSSLATLTEIELTHCYFDKLLMVLDRESVSEPEIEDILRDSRVSDTTALKPSVETFFHAYLLTLSGVNYVGHTHPVPVNQILCSGVSTSFAEERRFPDEVVCCGPVSLLIPYEDPGLALADEFDRMYETSKASMANRRKLSCSGTMA